MIRDIKWVSFLLVIFFLFSACGNSSDQSTSSDSYSNQSQQMDAPPPQEPENVSGSESRKNTKTSSDNYNNNEKNEAEEVQENDEEVSDGDCEVSVRTYAGTEAEVKMKSLTRQYTYKSGKVKRNKVKRMLNKDGYRKPDGSRFKRSDIPIYPE